MKIICQKSDLLASVNIALKAVSTKSTMTILECMVLEAKGDTIKLISNDMEIGIETLVKGEVREPGSVALNAKIFSEIIRRLPDNDVTVETGSSYQTTITCEKAKFTIPARSSEEFPDLSKIERNHPVVLSQFALKEVIRQTVFSISDNESNKIMTGELFEINQDQLRVASLDGFRISIRKVTLSEEYEPLKVIVPGKTLNDISKILSDDTESEVRMYFTGQHVLFEFDDTILLSRLIEGQFYRIDQMLSGAYQTKITANKKDLVNCIGRTTLLIKESEKKPVIIGVTDEKMELQMQSSIGSMDEELDIVKEGKDILIGFSPNYLLDALRVIDDEEVDIYMVNPKAPCFIKDKDETYIYLILPVNFNAAAR